MSLPKKYSEVASCCSSWDISRKQFFWPTTPYCRLCNSAHTSLLRCLQFVLRVAVRTRNTQPELTAEPTPSIHIKVSQPATSLSKVDSGTFYVLNIYWTLFVTRRSQAVVHQLEDDQLCMYVCLSQNDPTVLLRHKNWQPSSTYRRLVAPFNDFQFGFQVIRSSREQLAHEHEHGVCCYSYTIPPHFLASSGYAHMRTLLCGNDTRSRSDLRSTSAMLNESVRGVMHTETSAVLVYAFTIVTLSVCMCVHTSFLLHCVRVSIV